MRMGEDTDICWDLWKHRGECEITHCVRVDVLVFTGRNVCMVHCSSQRHLIHNLQVCECTRGIEFSMAEPERIGILKGTLTH